MNDTHPSIAAEYHERLMSQSNETRLLMGSRMFDACREIVMASMPKDLTERELRVRLFLRFYGSDFDEKTREKIVHHLNSM